MRTSLEIQRVDESEEARLLDNDVEMGIIDRSSGTYLAQMNIEYVAAVFALSIVTSLEL